MQFKKIPYGTYFFEEPHIFKLTNNTKVALKYAEKTAKAAELNQTNAWRSLKIQSKPAPSSILHRLRVHLTLFYVNCMVFE